MPTVLMLSANPKGTTPLRLDEERREVEAGLIERSKLRDNFKLVAKSALRTRDLHRALIDYQPNILHFSGHGTGAQGLVLEDEDGGGKTVAGEAIAQLLALFKDSLQCVVLNACYSEVQAKAISEHIPFVIGMSDEIGDRTAIEFAVAFYDAIGAGRDIKFAFDLATVAIKLAGIDQDHVPVLLSKEPESKPLTTLATIAFSIYNPDTFTGREEETRAICEQLQRGCRVVAIVGMTGVGKTALAERAIAQLAGDAALPYVRFSLDDRSIGTEFSIGGAALLRELGDEPTLEDQKDSGNLVGHIVSRLQSHPCRLQIDSMERLLQGDEQDGWSEFCDPLWLSLFERVLAVGQCGSQVILTTQDVPGELEGVGDRFRQLWHCQPLQGLSQQEQVELFGKFGLVDEGHRLQSIGRFYDGHPLVLQVIADEIKQRPFNGSVSAYWERHGEEFGGATPARVGDRSRIFRTRVRQRVEQTIESLPQSARQLLSACSVFHRPVPETFWIEVAERNNTAAFGFLKIWRRLSTSMGFRSNDPYAAFDFLKGRNLIEYVDVPGQASLVRLHNLIRSVAYRLLRGDLEGWEKAERKAAELWLTAYVVPDDAPKIEAVRGYLEAFDHLCEVRDWEKVREVAWTELDTPTRECLCGQLGIWGYFQEQVLFCKKQLKMAQIHDDKQEIGSALGNLGNAYHSLGQFQHAVELYQQSLAIQREIGDRWGEGNALRNLGVAYNSLGQYQKAIDFLQQSLAIQREIGDRRGEGNALCSLGNVYLNLGQFQQAIVLYQQHLTIAREIGNRSGEAAALANMGETERVLHQYPESLANTQAALQIFQDIGYRQGESEAFLSLAKLHHDTNNTTQALHFYQQSLAIASDLGIPLKAEC